MAAPINVYLIGKQGCGKSAVGNTLLRKKVFTSRASSNAVTAQVQKETVTVHSRQIHIWDTPGITEVQSQTDAAVGWFIERINELKSECHVLMWVVRYGELCAPEDENLLKELTKKLPKAFLKNHTIVVVTHKDNFESDTEDSGLTFDNWVKQQTGFFKKLCSSVAHKVLPIDNRSKPEGQLSQIFQFLLQETSSAGSDSGFESVDHPLEPSSLTIPLPTLGGAIHGRPAMNQTPVVSSTRSTRQQDVTSKKAKRMCGTDVDMKEERRGAIDLFTKGEQGTTDAILKVKDQVSYLTDTLSNTYCESKLGCLEKVRDGLKEYSSCVPSEKRDLVEAIEHVVDREIAMCRIHYLHDQQTMEYLDRLMKDLLSTIHNL